jgi:hypothetical protein
VIEIPNSSRNLKRDGRRTGLAFSQNASFFEAEISRPATEGLADNHVIEHIDLQNPSSSAQPAGQPEISFTGT